MILENPCGTPPAAWFGMSRLLRGPLVRTFCAKSACEASFSTKVFPGLNCHLERQKERAESALFPGRSASSSFSFSDSVGG